LTNANLMTSMNSAIVVTAKGAPSGIEWVVAQDPNANTVFRRLGFAG